MERLYSTLPPVELLWHLFDYKPLTGELVRRVSINNRTRVGSIVGSLRRDGYYNLFINNKCYLRHRVIYCWLTGKDPGTLIVDHRNRIPGEDTPWNLRAVTCEQSSWNTKGVSVEQRKNGRWSARICLRRKRYNLGTFDTRKEAENAYRAAAVKLHGQYACLALRS